MQARARSLIVEVWEKCRAHALGAGRPDIWPKIDICFLHRQRKLFNLRPICIENLHQSAGSVRLLVHPTVALIAADGMLLRMEATELLSRYMEQHPEVLLLFTNVQMLAASDRDAFAYEVAQRWP